MSINFQNNMPTLKKLQQRLETAQMQNNVLESECEMLQWNILTECDVKILKWNDIELYNIRTFLKTILNDIIQVVMSKIYSSFL